MQQVFAINIGTLPNKRWHPFRRRMCERALLNTPGMIDFFEVPEHGTIVVFGTLAHAQKAMDAMKKSGNPVEDVVFLTDADYESYTFCLHEPMEEAEVLRHG